MKRRVPRGLLFLVGVALIVVLVSRLPADLFATTQTILVVASAALLLLLGAAAFLTPARRLLGRLFTFDVPKRPALAIATEAEWRDLLRPLLAALVCLAVAGLPALLR